MNKLHRFLRQRSAPATGSPPPTISITKNDDDAQIKNSVTLKVPLLSKSEGNRAVLYNEVFMLFDYKFSYAIN